MSTTTTTSGAPLSPTPLPLPPSSSSLILQSAASFRIRAPVTADSDSSDFDSNVSDDDFSPAPLHTTTTTTPESQNPKAVVMPVAQLSLDDDDHHHDLDFDSEFSDEENSALPAVVKVPTLDDKSNAVVKSLVFGGDTEEDTDDDNQSVSDRNLDSAQLNSSSGYDSTSVQLFQVTNEEERVLPEEGNSAVAAEDVVIKHFEVQVENLPVESAGDNDTDQNERHTAVKEQEEEEPRSIVAADAGSTTRPKLDVEFHENGQIGISEADNFEGKTKLLLPGAVLEDITFGGGFEVCSDSQTNNGQMIAVGTEMELREKRENENSEEGHFDFEGKSKLPLPDADLQDLAFGGGFEVCSDSQTNSGQMIAVGTEMELEENYLYDSAALASSSPVESEGSSFTMVTSCDESRQAVSPDWSADTGSSSFRGMIPPPLDSAKVILSEGNVNEEFIVKFLRLIHRLGYSPQHPIAAQVMYSLVGKGYGTQELSFDRLAMELQEEGKEDDVELCLNILVIGKTGVGKSSTINSIFGEKKVAINAFEPATTYVKEVCGTVSGVRIRIFDTPGLRPSIKEASANRKILASVKKLTKKSPPDIVLYIDRLDDLSSDQTDVTLLSEVTKSLTSSIWENAIVVLTHASSLPPEGPSGSPLSFEEFVTRRSDVVHQAISLAVGDPLLMHRRPVALAENQQSTSSCFNWNAQLLLMCCSVKILSEAKSVAKFQAGSPGHAFLPLLQNVLFCDDDEYDQLPSFKPLSKSQVEKLSKEQKKAYLDEYDYRLQLLHKKQWREEVKEMNSNEFKALPDVSLPTSFDSSYPSFRYRALETTSRFLVRPVMGSNGWDHDYGYDGLSIETDHDYGAFAVQVTKDKKQFNLVVIANLQSQVCIERWSKMDIGVWMNNKRRGKISIKTNSSSSDLQIFAVMGAVPLAMAVLRSIFGERK